MRVKGAFPVRWKPQDGANGTGVTVTSSVVKYASSSSGTTHPNSGWQTTVPTVTNGMYLWTWTHIVYSDGTYTDMYSVSRMGIDGKGIQSSVVKYCQKADTNTDPESFPESDWGSFPTTLTDGYWLYTRTHMVYSDGSTTNSYSVAQVGVGSYYAGCQEYYTAGESPTVCPDGAPAAGTYANGTNPQIGNAWSQQRPTLSASTPYLWNFEISADSRGNKYVTGAICLGNFAKGITSIVETYAISSRGVPESGRDYPSDITEQMWVDEHQDAAPTEAKPYQWNKTVVTYNDNSKDTHYHVSAVKGADGKGATYIDLDNQNDSLLYDGADNLVGGSNGYVYSNCRLYSNGADISSQVTFDISSKSSSVDADINVSATRQLRVKGMTSDTGYVIVRCYYGNVYYYSRFTISKLKGVDKFELVITPNALTYNTTKQTGGNQDVNIKVYRTAQNGSRTLVENLADYSLTLRYYYDSNGPTAITDGTTSGKYHNGATKSLNAASWSSYRYELLDSNSKILDVETVPISKTTDGDIGYSIVTSVARNNFTESQWETYGTVGHEETWTNTSSLRNGARSGDLFTIVGTATDTGNGHTATYRCDNSSGDLHGVCISHEITEAGDDAVNYDIVFTEAWARVSETNIITAALKGYAYRIEGSVRTALNGVTIRFGYKTNDSSTYTTTETNSSGYFSEDNWFDGDEFSPTGYSKGSKSIFASIIINGTVMCTRFVTMIPDGKTGAGGDDYLPIDCGIYDPSRSYSWANGRREFVDFEIDNTYYRFGVKSKGQTVAANNPPVSGGNSKWEQANAIQTLLTNCIFGTNANIGGFLLSNENLRSSTVAYRLLYKGNFATASYGILYEGTFELNHEYSVIYRGFYIYRAVLYNGTFYRMKGSSTPDKTKYPPNDTTHWQTMTSAEMDAVSHQGVEWCIPSSSNYEYQAANEINPPIRPVVQYNSRYYTPKGSYLGKRLFNNYFSTTVWRELKDDEYVEGTDGKTADIPKFILDGHTGTIKMKQPDDTVYTYDESGKFMSGNEDGQKVIIDPATKSVSVYDSNNAQVISINGEKKTSISSAYEGDSGSTSVAADSYGLNQTAPSSGCKTARDVLYPLSNHFTLGTGQWNVNYNGSISVNAGYTTSSSWCPGQDKSVLSYIQPIKIDGNTWGHQSYCKAELVLVNVTSGNVITLASQTQGNQGAVATNTFSSNVRVSAGEYYLAIRYSYALYSSHSLHISWTAISVAWAKNGYMGEVFGNGLAFGNNAQNFFAIVKASDTNLQVKAVSNNQYGFEITSSGLKIMVGGTWYTARLESGQITFKT